MDPRIASQVGGNSIAVMGPDDRCRVHTHAAPEAWFIIAGALCWVLQGQVHEHAEDAMTVAAGRPMELSVIGNEVAKSMSLVIHDSTQDSGAASDWLPTGGCRAK